MELDEFREWLTESIMPDKARCKACCKEITAGKSELLNHGKSKKHQTNFYKMLSGDKDQKPVVADALVPLTLESELGENCIATVSFILY